MAPKDNTTGFTFAELMLALTITTIIALAVVTLGSALSSAHGQTGQLQESILSARGALLSMGSHVRRAKLATAAGDGLSLWTGDANADGTVNVDELVLFERRDGDRAIVRRRVVFPDGMSLPIRQALNEARDLAQVDSIDEVRDLLDATAYNGYREETVVATDVASFATSTDAAPPMATLIGLKVAVGPSERQIAVHTAVRIRADATGDVVFVDGQPRLQP